MSPARLVVPSTFLTCKACGNFLVPSPRERTVRSSMKLWVAPLSNSACVLVDLCHMFTRTEIVIESSFILYMVAKVTGAATFRTRQNKNPLPYPVRPGRHRILPRSLFLRERVFAAQLLVPFSL